MKKEHCKYKLAIVIPAYNNSFLKDTLDALANQTCKDFTVYIGDDNSPNNLYEIVERFEDKLNIVYKRFDTNVGGIDLVKQWERCIALSEEEWIWLFSDDDIMDVNCVEAFYSSIEEHHTFDFFHFNIDVIDRDNKILWNSNPFPKQMQVNDFFTKRITYKVRSTVVEYVFKRTLYDRCQGFQNFDLAWCSDDATWIKFGASKGILTIPGAKVQWRYSGENISSKVGDSRLVLRKLESTAAYLKWVETFFNKQSMVDTSSTFTKMTWGIAPVLETPSINLTTKLSLVKTFTDSMGYINIKRKAQAYLLVWEFKNKVKRFLKLG